MKLLPMTDRRKRRDFDWPCEARLATLHAFDGWADEFTTAPATDLDDTYARADLAGQLVSLAKMPQGWWLRATLAMKQNTSNAST